MRTLALFDFDNTLYKKDSLIEFTIFSKGLFPFFRGILLLSPYLLALKLNMISNEKAKIKFISYFFKELEYEKFKSLGRDFSLKIENNLHKEIFAKFKNHIQLGHLVYIVTASIPEWIQPWSDQFNVKVIGTLVEIKEVKLTGKFVGKNCFGNEKVNRITKEMNLTDFDDIYVYGSGKGDLEMLGLRKTTNIS